MEKEIKQLFVYFIRPKPRKNFDNMCVFLSCAFSEEQAWEFVLKEIPNAKQDYYIDDFFVSQTGQALGLMWGNEKTI